MPEVLPPLLQKWIDQLLPEGIPSETRASCGSCAMLPRNDGTDGDITFNAQTKCCTYYPDLANFYVGRILSDERPENYAGRRTIERRIAGKLRVTPYGISPPPTYMTLYSEGAMRNPEVFGRAASLQCPFYNSQFGECGIHQHRETICSTFFCKYERGPVGRTFWRALQKLLSHLESSLRLFALEKIDPTGVLTDTTITFVNQMKAQPLDAWNLGGGMQPGLYEKMWGPYAGREAELFRACAEHVEKLDLNQVLNIGGIEARMGARSVLRLFNGLRQSKHELPERVARGHNMLVQISRLPGKVRLKSASAVYDHVDVPDTAITAASRLVDRPLAEARADLEDAGIHLDDATIRWLIDFEVLSA